MPSTRFPPPWTIDEANNAWFIVRDDARTSAERRPNSSSKQKYASACPVASFAMKHAVVVLLDHPRRREAAHGGHGAATP
jgi:hypothetical protein